MRRPIHFDRKATSGFNVMYVIIPMIVIFLLWGLFQTFGSEVLEDVRSDMVDTSRRNCGTNSTGGSGGTLNYINCSYNYNISSGSLEAQNTLAEKQETTGKVVIAGVIIAVLLGVFGGYIMRKVM